jgi:hypothetical protein
VKQSHGVASAGHREDKARSTGTRSARRCANRPLDRVVGARRLMRPDRHWILKVALARRRRLLLKQGTQLRSHFVESQGPLAIIWVGIGLCCFYIALVWLNTLLGFFLTPLFIIPQTWILDYMMKRKQAKSGS